MSDFFPMTDFFPRQHHQLRTNCSNTWSYAYHSDHCILTGKEIGLSMKASNGSLRTFGSHNFGNKVAALPALPETS
ncbi:hypothetical protein STEG23_007115, partial [Scotinomys teguina]